MSVPIPAPTAPPYNLNKLQPPLTALQRRRLLAWAQRNGYTLPSGISDSNLIARCLDLWHGNIAGNPTLGNKLANVGEGAYGAAQKAVSTAEFLAKLAEFLLNPVRMGEFLVGGVLVVVGINAVLKNPVGGAVRGATKVASKLPTPAGAELKATQRAASRSYATSYAREAGKHSARKAYQ